MTTHSWPAFFTELANAILDGHDSASLLVILREANASGLKTVSLVDRVSDNEVPLAEIDPFTFFACINRNLTVPNRQALCGYFAERFGLHSPIPDHFNGVPVVDHTSAWFFPYSDKRDPGDIPALWELFRQAVGGGRDAVDAGTFARCLQIHRVAVAKLTMALFWVRSDEFLPLDRRTREIVDTHGVAVPKHVDWAVYRGIVEDVSARVSDDFPELSANAYVLTSADSTAARYWVGGHAYGDDGSQLERFLREGVWEFGWAKDDHARGARGAWARVARIRPGDLFAIKGYGGRNVLKVYAVGRVTDIDAEAGRVSFEPLDVPLFHGKAPGAPGDGTWFETLAGVTNKKAIAALFEGNVPSDLPADDETSPRNAAPQVPATNLVLYGPPGTGKTYSTVARALDLIDGRVPESRSDAMRRYRELGAAGRVETVTFHQAYGYEEFVEGIRPVLGSDGAGDVRYELHAGAFKQIALRAAAHGVHATPKEPDFDVLWEKLLEDIEADEQRLEQSVRGRTYLLEVSPSRRAVNAYPSEPGDDGDWEIHREKRQTASKHNLKIWWDHRDELGLDPDGVTYQKAADVIGRVQGSSGGHHFSPVWICYGLLLRIVKHMAGAGAGRVATPAEVQARLDDPSFDFSFGPSAPQYVLVIDEINRGNISKILGELITLLEPDKRLGAPNELRLPLAYSPSRRFGVPPNLHVVGTMNTADRSIALMDVALRRRFRFEEVMPSADVIRDMLAGEDVPDELVSLVVDVFETLNRRIRFLYDRDHQLGHSMFLGVRSLADLRGVFVDTIVPMLQEYFYGAWDKVAIVLGCPYAEDGRPYRGGTRVAGDDYRASILSRYVVDEEATLGFDHGDYESVVEHGIADWFTRSDASDERLALSFVDLLEGDPDTARAVTIVEALE